MSHRALTASITTGLVVAAAAVLVAGPLNPPAGPVTGTYKTLTEVEPRTAISATNTPGDADSLFKITQPGSYYLTGNIAGVIAKHGIEIAVGGVTLDLNGFEMLGIAGSLDGVNVALGLFTGIAVVNGSVRGWGDEGVDLGTNGAASCRVEGVLASLNAGNGISAGHSATLANCSANGNTGHGISASYACTITGCTAEENTGNGINTGTGCVVTHCAATGNTGSGINAGAGSTVADCAARANTLDGIACNSQCLIRANSCSANGIGDGAGIHATGTDNRIEGNHCTGADRGIDIDGDRNRIDNNGVSSSTVGFDIDGVDNIVMRNTASSNPSGNYSIIAGNSVAPLVGVVANNNWPAIPNSNHPFANFGY